MTKPRDPKKHSGQPTVYQIRIAGRLSPDWADWLEGLTITLADNGDTLFTGPVIDQAALFGLLKKSARFGNPAGFGQPRRICNDGWFGRRRVMWDRHWGDDRERKSAGQS